ncbi:MAG: ATP-binding protein [Nanoarchaeota archaeon]
MEKLGIVIATEASPSVSEFSFVIQNNKVRRGEFVSVKTDDGFAIANIQNIVKSNMYFESAGAVQEYSRQSDIHSAFPVKEWEHTIAEAKILGTYSSAGLLGRPAIPPCPGAEVSEIETSVLNKFLGLDQEKGIELGEVQQHNLKAKFNLTKMLQKHLAVLAMSGAGKSYAVSVLVEELLLRPNEHGRVAVLIIDNHGEYSSLISDPQLKDKIEVIDASEIKIGVPNISAKVFAQLCPSMSATQVRELNKVMDNLRGEGTFDVEKIISAVEALEMKENVSAPLLAWLYEIKSMGIFTEADYPNFDGLLKQGSATILDFKNVLDLRQKQMVVAYISRKLFNLRRKNSAPPYLEIIEEAHNFCPEGARSENALSRSIIETLAREGRKFYANICLISQRPVQLSTTALSQCNTQIILRVTNPYDLDHIKKSAESITQQTLEIISSLKVGEALVIGEAVNHPVFVKIRKRKSKESHGEKLEDYAIKFEKANEKLASGKDFI